MATSLHAGMPWFLYHHLLASNNKVLFHLDKLLAMIMRLYQQLVETALVYHCITVLPPPRHMVFTTLHLLGSIPSNFCLISCLPPFQLLHHQQECLCNSHLCHTRLLMQTQILDHTPSFMDHLHHYPIRISSIPLGCCGSFCVFSSCFLFRQNFPYMPRGHFPQYFLSSARSDTFPSSFPTV